eukprot:1162014-Pleurochrysis_carterae.AAC.1
MECRGKLHIAMSEAMGRPPMVAALCAGGSAAAVELAVADWAALLERAGGAEAVWGERRPPVGWAEAARRVVHVLTAAASAPRAGGGAGGEGGGGSGAGERAQGSRPASGKDGATAKLVALKSSAGEAGRRASAAA